MRPISLRALVGLALVITGESRLDVQAQASRSDQRPPGAFEVASVKENRLPLDGQLALRPRIRRHPAGHFDASWVTLRLLIMEVYGVRPYQILDAPEWVLTDHFDVETRAPLGADAADTDAMLRLVLEDRFGLVVRHETRRIPTYALEIADRQRGVGPGIRRPPERCESIAAQRNTPQSSTAQTALRDGLPDCQHAWGWREPGWMFVRSGPIASLSRMLEGGVGRPVIDNTGLTGAYDIDLRFAPERALRLADDGWIAPVDEASAFTAVREQLGLNLRPRQDEFPVLVVAGVRRPSPN
jgi:uncharacterized protein (TIGR03435 family)